MWVRKIIPVQKCLHSIWRLPDRNSCSFSPVEVYEKMSFCLDLYLYFPDELMGSITHFRFHWIKNLKINFQHIQVFETKIIEPSAQDLRLKTPKYINMSSFYDVMAITFTVLKIMISWWLVHQPVPLVPMMSIKNKEKHLCWKTKVY